MQTKYEKIAEELKNKIIQGSYSKDKKLPTEEVLMETFKVSRNTVRKAVDVLVNRGCVYRVQGSGIFLRDIHDKEFKEGINISGLSKNFSRDEIKSKVEELSVIMPDEFLMKKLDCTNDTKIYYLKRIRYVKNEPIEIEESYYNKNIVPYLNKEICENSIFNYIREDLKLSIGFANRIVSCEKLNKEEAEFINLKEGDPCLKLENIIALNNGKVFDYSIEKYNYKKVKLYNIT